MGKTKVSERKQYPFFHADPRHGGWDRGHPRVHPARHAVGGLLAMPLLIPGLDEDAAKTLSKRLHKSLKQHEGALTLTQLQRLIAQAVGHADWHAAQAFWSSSPIVSKLSEQSKEMETRVKKQVASIEDLMASFSDLLPAARNGSRRALSSLPHCLDLLATTALGQGLTYEKTLFERAKSIAEGQGQQVAFPDPLEFDKVERLYQKACQGFYPIYFRQQPIPNLPPEPLGIDDEELLAPVIVEEMGWDYERHCEEAEDDAWHQEQNEIKAEMERTWIVVRAQIDDLMNAFDHARSGNDNAWKTMSAHAKSLKESLFGYGAYPALTRIEGAVSVAAIVNDGSIEERMEGIDRIENHLRRARVDLIKIFGGAPPETFPSAVHEIEHGACLIGDWSLLEVAIRQSGQYTHVFHGRDYEASPAVSDLCQWWNTNAPEASRHARCFMVGVVSGGHVSYLGYDECPKIYPEDFSKSSSYAVFQSPNGFTYVVQFLRGSNFNKIENGGYCVYEADGTLMWEVGTDECNESYYSIQGLHALRSDVQTRCGA
jgi:hypothetical protein